MPTSRSWQAQPENVTLPRSRRRQGRINAVIAIAQHGIAQVLRIDIQIVGRARGSDLQRDGSLPPRFDGQGIQPLFLQIDFVAAGGRPCLHAREPEGPPEGYTGMARARWHCFPPEEW